MFLGTLWISIKKVKAPYVFDGEHGIALHAMQGNGASSGGEGEVSRFFSTCAGSWGIFSSYGGIVIQNSCLFSKVRTPV